MREKALIISIVSMVFLIAGCSVEKKTANEEVLEPVTGEVNKAEKTEYLIVGEGAYGHIGDNPGVIINKAGTLQMVDVKNVQIEANVKTLTGSCLSINNKEDKDAQFRVKKCENAHK